MITVSDQAKQHIIDQLTTRGSGAGIRILVNNSGCSGLSYALEFLDAINEDDEVFKFDNFVVGVDKKSLTFIDGTHIEVEKEGFNTGLVFSNPNSKGTCGCGESFSV